MNVPSRKLSASTLKKINRSLIKVSNFSNKNMHAFMHVLTSMMNVDLPDVINNTYLEELRECDYIYSAKCKVATTIKGKLWLAPQYKPADKEIKIRRNQFILVREGEEAVDLEIGTEVYTLTPQAWREKKGYFLIAHPSRFKGSLEQNVKRIIQIRKSNGREKSSGTTGISRSS